MSTIPPPSKLPVAPPAENYGIAWLTLAVASCAGAVLGIPLALLFTPFVVVIVAAFGCGVTAAAKAHLERRGIAAGRVSAAGAGYVHAAFYVGIIGAAIAGGALTVGICAGILTDVLRGLPPIMRFLHGG